MTRISRKKPAIKKLSKSVPKQVKRGRSATVTIHDVAAKAGVSIKTVSRVINSEPTVVEATVKLVQQAISELNYQPNFSARNLASSRAFVIALLYDNPSDNYLVSVQEGVLSAAQQTGYGVLLQPCKYDNPHLIDKVLSLVAARRPAGLILTPPLCDLEHLLTALDKNGIDYATLAPLKEDDIRPFVAIDDRAASYELTNYLIERGHRRIGFIKGHPAVSASPRRLQGFLDAHKDRNLSVDKALIVQGLFTFESGCEGARRLLHLSKRPTAIFASNDDMAAGVLHVAHEMDIDVPTRLSVAGYDDTPISRYVYPSLTTVRQPIRQMGYSAVQCLVAAIRQRAGSAEKTPISQRFDYELVIRDSVGPAST